MLRLINIGFGNMVAADRIIAIASPDSAPVKRLIQEARERHRVVLQMDSDHLILSAIQPETIAGRLTDKDPSSKDEEREA